MERPQKSGFLPAAKAQEKSKKFENPLKTYLTNGTGRIDPSRALITLLSTLVLVFLSLTWLPEHFGENLIIPGETILFFILLFLNGRLYRWEASLSRQLVFANLVIQVVIIEATSWIYPNNGVFFQLFALPFQVYRAYGDKAGVRVSFLTWMAFIAHCFIGFDDLQARLLAFLLGTLSLVMLVTKFRQDLRERLERERREQLLAELEVSHRQLKAYSEQIEELATIEERNRLAREIHDSLGHYLTAINIQLEKAMLQHDAKPDEAMQTISETKRLASEALQDVRRSVGTLREQAVPTFSIVEKLNALATEVRRNNTFDLKLEIEGSEQNFSNQILQTLYRVAQEGLTNIQKYALPRHVLIRLKLTGKEAHLLVQDDGVGFDTANLLSAGQGKSGGYGLQGIRERLELVGGNFELESASGVGTTLRVTAPKDPFNIRSLNTLLRQS